MIKYRISMALNISLICLALYQYTNPEIKIIELKPQPCKQYYEDSRLEFMGYEQDEYGNWVKKI